MQWRRQWRLLLFYAACSVSIAVNEADVKALKHETDHQPLLSITVAGSNVTVQQNRDKRARLIKKILKKSRKIKVGAVRLVEGRNRYEGNVEILHAGTWGNVCDDEWDVREANVVCRQLGLGKALNAKHTPTYNSKFGAARRKYWMDNVYCTGEEKQLGECRFDGWGTSDCEPSEAAGVVCSTVQEEVSTTPAPIAEVSPQRKRLKHIKDRAGQPLEVRLTGGRVPDEGKVEIKVGPNGTWSLICGDGWGMLEAAVVCRQLGFGYANAAVQTDFFGGRSTNNSSALSIPMILSGVQCQGTEATIDACLHDQYHDVFCPGKTDNIAGVVCTQALADLVIDHYELMRSTHLEDRQLHFLQCAMEENCLASNAYVLQKENSAGWHLETRRLLRFTATIHNVGTADFRPFVPKHLWQYHLCHMHYHSMEVFATFDILDSSGRRVAEGHKASFCLEDNKCLPGVKPVYACANYGDQGITVGCADIYRYNIDCQWVDISELAPGMYTMKVAVNPELKIAEQTYENNAAVCNLLYTENFAHVFNCTLQRP